MIVKLLTEHNLEFVSLKGGCTGSYESTLVKMPHCSKSHDMAQIAFDIQRRTLCIKQEHKCTKSWDCVFYSICEQ